jgi:hypothetical protein
VLGSRTLKDERVKIILLEMIEKYKPIEIVTTQEPAGVCEVAQKVAKETATPLHLFFLNFRYLRGAFERRSKEAIKYADVFIIVHDGESKGTANELAMVKKSGKPHEYHVLEVTKQQKSVGFNITDEWDISEDAENDLWQ